jgi:hypothetical protein
VGALKQAIPDKNKMPSLLELEQIKYLVCSGLTTWWPHNASVLTNIHIRF